MSRMTSTAITMPAMAPPLRPVAAAAAADATGGTDGLVVGLAWPGSVGVAEGFKVSPFLVGFAVVGTAVGETVGIFDG